MTLDEYDYEGEALEYLREEAGTLARYEKWKSYFHSMLFMMGETYQHPVTRGEYMQVAYDIVDDWDK